jgi:hypothetical protein
MYPYVIPFSGAPMAADRSLLPHTRYKRQYIAGTDVSWDQPVKILPADPTVQEAILAIEQEFDKSLEYLQSRATHLPSRVRSLVWVWCASRVLRRMGTECLAPESVLDQLFVRLPRTEQRIRKGLGSIPEPILAAGA